MTDLSTPDTTLPDAALPDAALTNFEIAERFVQIADILEIQGENPFKVRAYRTAASTINDLEDSLAEIAARGKLAEIPGFGPAIVGKVQDFLETGTTALWDRVKDAVPRGVVEIAQVPGIGVKTVKTLWETLKVDSVAALHEAAKAEKVRDLPGFGPAKEKKLIENIEKWYRLNERTPRYLAMTWAVRVARRLTVAPEVAQVEIAGELRRGCDTVAENPVLYSGPDLAATDPLLLANSGVTVHVTSANRWGSELCRLTGPETHWNALRARADDRQVDVSAFATEEALYDSLGLPMIPPELRDWDDVLALSERGELPHLITEADFRGQLHEHSTWSDGTATMRQMAEAALARGYAYLAITDHSRSLVIANGLNRERHLAQLDEIAALNTEFAGRITLLAGIEADILADGSLDCDDDILERLDLVVGSVHIRHREDEAGMTRRICTALENPHLTILGHPTGRLLGRREPYPVDMDAVIECAAKHKKVLEINASPDRMDLNDTYARRAKDAGVLLTINADAHSTAGLGLLPWGLCMARRAGLTPEDVVNTFPLQRLRDTVLRVQSG
ncbi:MAG: DNA polymerase/3'-5' exonuclease PolX [Armatimonadaceae bacterium]